ncbi:PLDc N-terminal domain-containing protein [Bacillus sp. UNC41MFS5]|uniref:PLDc N-terminal domain-containing protein n=1 Tax=Bacillus sp. UNC41MFS5 TaxID=1449046 RepID=UPI00047DBAFD|nr:PLDc N-terminal domain-containing protein [Bacillus sp. UNC41MFS5]
MQLHYELEDIKEIDFMAFIPFILPFIVIGSLLVFIALLDLFRHRKVRKNLPIWTMIIIFINIIGPILYFVLGRKDSESF